MEELKATYAKWNNFTNTREAERAKVMNPEHTVELRNQIKDKKAEVLRAQAELQMLQAQLTLSGADGTPYRKAAFDLEWGQRKANLKYDLETLIAEQLEAGVSVPKLMKALQCKSPNLIYNVKENLELYRGAAREEVAETKWHWSDAVSVHRYGLGYAPDDSTWGFAILHGAIDTEYENKWTTFDYGTQNFIAGDKALFDSVPASVKKTRTELLAQILDGTYTKKIRRDENPYFVTQ